MLGVPQEVVAPADGVVGASLVEPGEAVEYGQELIVIELAADGRRRRTADGRGLMFRKILIANRGEIALRILRACRTLGHRGGRRLQRGRPRHRCPSSSPTRRSASARPTPAGRYLSAPAVISAALVTGCDAIHPGYGFLSEDDGLRRGRPRPTT